MTEGSTSSPSTLKVYEAPGSSRTHSARTACWIAGKSHRLTESVDALNLLHVPRRLKRCDEHSPIHRRPAREQLLMQKRAHIVVTCNQSIVAQGF